LIRGTINAASNSRQRIGAGLAPPDASTFIRRGKIAVDVDFARPDPLTSIRRGKIAVDAGLAPAREGRVYGNVVRSI
jgi:hypothetical protein